MSEIQKNIQNGNPLFREFRTDQAEQDQIFQSLLNFRLETAKRLAILKDIVELQLGHQITPQDLADFVVFLNENRGVYVSDRNYSDIAADHGMSNYQLAKFIEGNTVLDVGAGHSTFAQAVLDKKYKSKVVSLDLNEQALKGVPGSKTKANAGALPFREGQFDTVLATASVPLWNNSPEEVSKSTTELMRVAKSGGYILISPLVGFALRPPLAKDGSEIGTETVMFGRKGRRDTDPRAHYILNLNEIAFISALEGIKNSKKGEMVFTKTDSDIKSLIIRKIG